MTAIAHAILATNKAVKSRRLKKVMKQEDVDDIDEALFHEYEYSKSRISECKQKIAWIKHKIEHKKELSEEERDELKTELKDLQQSLKYKVARKRYVNAENRLEDLKEVERFLDPIKLEEKTDIPNPLALECALVFVPLYAVTYVVTYPLRRYKKNEKAKEGKKQQEENDRKKIEERAGQIRAEKVAGSRERIAETLKENEEKADFSRIESVVKQGNKFEVAKELVDGARVIKIEDNHILFEHGFDIDGKPYSSKPTIELFRVVEGMEPEAVAMVSSKVGVQSISCLVTKKMNDLKEIERTKIAEEEFKAAVQQKIDAATSQFELQK